MQKIEGVQMIPGIPDDYILAGGAAIMLLMMIEQRVRKELKEMHPEWTDEQIDSEISRQRAEEEL